MSGPITSPTPWRHSSTGGAETIVDRTGATVAILGRGMEPGNGALIVAAPEMYAALERCSELFSAIRGDWTDPRSECREGQEVIRAALAKAVSR